MTSGESVAIVFWDLGGVILRTENPERRRAWEARLGLGEGELEKLVFNGPASVEAMLGRASADDVWSSVGSGLELTDDERDRMRADFFATDRIDAGLAAFIRGLRPRVRAGLISNAWPEIRGLLETKWALADAFEPLVLSSEVGLVKPDPRIYLLALGQASVEATQAVFVDDFPVNLEAAGKLGMHTVLFRTSAQAQEDVARLVEGK